MIIMQSNKLKIYKQIRRFHKISFISILVVFCLFFHFVLFHVILALCVHFQSSHFHQSCVLIFTCLPIVYLFIFQHTPVLDAGFSVSGIFSMMLHILLNVLPCSGFVKKSASMFVVGQKATLTSPFLFCLKRRSSIH